MADEKLNSVIDRMIGRTAGDRSGVLDCGPAGAGIESAVEPTETDFAELPDGSLLEMIEDPEDSSKSLFVLFKDGEARLVDHYWDGGKLFVPIGRHNHILEHVRFATGVENYESVEALIGKTASLILKCLDIDAVQGTLLICFILSSWVIDQIPVAPYLALIGLPQSGKSTALALLNLLCRRALFTGDITSAAFYEVCHVIAPTLLIDEPGTAGDRRSLFHLLRTGSTRDVTAVRKSRCFKTFGAKAMSWQELPNDPALNSRCISISMVETRRTDLKKTSSPEIVEAAAELQKQFLHFRLANYKNLRLREVPGAEKLHSRARDLYEAFTLALSGHPEMCRSLIGLFEQHQERSREPLTLTQSILLQTLFALVHLPAEIGTYRVESLTNAVNNELQLNGEVIRIKPREVGASLTSLGVTERKRTNQGWVVLLDRKTQKRIHQLVDTHGLDAKNASRADKREDCELCAECK